MIAAPARPALVVAGAGAGKTETMAARVVWLVAIGAVLPEQVLGLTFTRKAAQQLGARVRSRLRRLAGSRLLDELDPSGERRAALLAGEPTVSTYHAYAGRLVGEHALRLPAEPAARLLGETASWQLAHRVVSTWADELDVDVLPATVTTWLLALAGELGEHLVEPEAVRAHAERMAAVLEAAPRGKGQRAEPSQTYQRWIATQRKRVALLPLVEAFVARKRAERAVDFADQLAIAARVADAHPEVGATERATYRAVLLDEYQDTGHAQRVLLRALFGTRPGDPVRPGGPTVTAVGDPCQSIYGWRGASAGNLARFRTDFPAPDGPADQYGLLTSFRNPPEVLRLANAVSAPLREAGARHRRRVTLRRLSRSRVTLRDVGAGPRRTGPAHVGVGELRPAPDAQAGDVRVALLPDVAAEIDWMADAVAAQWAAAAEGAGPPPTSAVLVRRRADMDAIAAALRARGLPVEVVGLGGLLDTPEVRDLVSALRLVADPLAGPAAVRLLTGARWRLGVADLAALWPRARELVPPPPPQPGAHPHRAGPRRAARRAGRAGGARRRARRPRPGHRLLARRLRPHRPPRPRAGLAARPGGRPAHRPRRRRRARAAARRRDRRPPGPGRPRAPRRVRRRGRRVRGGRRGGHPARAARLPGDRREGRGRADPRRGRGRARPRPGAHRARREGPGVGGRGRAAPGGAGVPRPQDRRHLAHQPGRAARPAARRRRRPARLRPPRRRRPQAPARTPSRRTPRPSTRAGWSRSGACSTWRSPAPSGCCCSPGTAGPRPASKPRLPSEFLTEVAEAHGARGVGREPDADAVNPATVDQATALWPADPLGARSADVHAGAELVRAALRGPARRPRGRHRPRRPAGAARPRTAARARRRRTRRAGPPTSTCCSPSGPPPRAPGRGAAPAAHGEPARRAGRRPRRARGPPAPPAAAAPQPARPPRHRVPRLAGAAVRRRAAARPRRAARRRRRGRRLRRRARRAAGGLPRQRRGPTGGPSRSRCRSRR